MKSFCALIAGIAMVRASGVTMAAQMPAFPPQASAQSASVPTLVRVDGELKTPTGAPRTGTVSMVASLYTDKQDSTPLWVEPQLVTFGAAGRYTLFVGTGEVDGVSKEFYGVPKEFFGDFACGNSYASATIWPRH